MKWMGGKARLATRLAEEIEKAKFSFGKSRFVEPFCGGANVSLKVLKGSSFQEFLLNDANAFIMKLYQEVVKGWQPPSFIDGDDYRRARDGLLDPALTGFILGPCSFAGKWRGGMARNSEGRNYAQEAARSLKEFQAAASSKSIEFCSVDYRELEIRGLDVVYCDPPYAGTTEYKDQEKFSHEEFWQWCRSKARETGAVFLVSEREGPHDIPIVAEWPRKNGLKSGRNGKDSIGTIEKLFLLAAK